jgi:hypothetical protein
MNLFRQKSWSPYVAGALAGLVLCLSVLVAGKYLGASTTYVRTTGLIEKVFAPERVSGMDYFVKTKIKVDWQMLFVVGIIFGALLASKISKDFKLTAVPPMWNENFGPGKSKRFLAVFVGGTVAMFGARMAGG